MIRYLFLLLIANAIVLNVFSQADNCSSATLLSVTATCSSPVSGTTAGATQSIAGCVGTADDDVWYRFVATSTSHSITVTPSASMDAVVQLFSVPCSSLVSLACRDTYLSGQAETINYSGLTVGATYRIRVYHYYTGSGSGNFTICVTPGPTPPSNDLCSSPISLSVNSSCTPTTGTLAGATQSLAGCAGDADDDVWYSFTATNAVQDVTVTPLTSGLDMVLQVFSGSCSGLTSLGCVDNTFSGQAETINLVGLTPGNVYRIRVYDYYTGNSGNFQICVTGTPTSAPTNDAPCNAIAIPPVTSACNYMSFTNVGATASTGAPTPYSCGGSSPYQGGFNSSSRDVWFSITVPSSGSINITSEPNMGSGSITDGVMALYSGTCSSLTQIGCSDDFNYPGSSNDGKPMMNYTGLTPGSTVYLRYWGYNTAQGNFGFCVSTATNDACANALYICDINGYSGSTSAAFTPDRPGNMHGNNENSSGTNLVDGTNSGGPFGYYPPSNVPGPYSSPAIDVNIENNSWIRFTAAATTATLTVSVYDCYVGNYPSGGIQMQIFSSTGCSNFTPISNFEENSTGFTITASGLTVGNDYILMVDGYAGDICSYTISANTGVLFPNIPPVPPICYGQSTTLTAPPGATSYSWFHDGSTTQSVTVTPGTTQTYYCEVTGLCDHKQTLSVQVVVNPTPTVTITPSSSGPLCSGNSITLTASGASSYSWSNGATTSSITVSPTSSTIYSVTGTSGGCSATASYSLTVNPTPTVSITPSTTGPICSGNSITLTASGASSYSWSNGATGSSITVSPTSSTSYTVTGTSSGCSATANYSVTVNPTPTVSITPNPSGAICNGSSVTLTASGTASSYSWSTGSNASSITVSPTTTTNYSVTGTLGSCTATANYSVTVNPTPVISGTATATPSDCGASTGSISGLSVSTPPSYTAEWRNSSNVVVGTSLNINNIPAGSYTLTVTNTYGCTAQYGPVIITNPGAPSAPTITVSDNFVCNGGTVSFTITPQAGATYEWTGPGGLITTNNQFTINNFTPADDGNYCAVITVGGCSSTPTCQTVSLSPGPSVNITTSGNGLLICSGQTATLTATGGLSYSWTGPNSYTGTGGAISIQPFTAVNEGNYIVTATDSDGCTNSDTVFVDALDLPLIDAVGSNPNGMYCNNTSATLSANGASNYTWTAPDNSTHTTNPFVINEVNSSTVGWYTVTGTDANNCSATDSVQVQFSTLDVDAQGGDIVCPGGTVNFTASTGATYNWSGPQGQITTDQNFVLTNAATENSGWYYVTVTDSSNCSGTDSTLLSVEPKAECLVIPDLVTPDGDNHNDTWYIPGLDSYPNVEVEIYNRWGNLIYKTDQYQNDWWGEVNHGASIGKGKVPTGTYFYILILNDADDTPPYKGYIEVEY